MSRTANRTSFKTGHKRSQESIEKQRKTLRERGLPEHLKQPPTPETIVKRAATRRRRALGNRYKVINGNTAYWKVLTENGYRYEHRVVMEQTVGRPLARSEHVHHINHDGLDNRPDNLRLMPIGDHNREHAPTRRRGSSKLPPGVWSRKHERCVECGTTDRKHVARGLCTTCYRNQYPAY